MNYSFLKNATGMLLELFNFVCTFFLIGILRSVFKLKTSGFISFNKVESNCSVHHDLNNADTVSESYCCLYTKFIGVFT